MAPLVEGPVARDAEAAALISGGHKAEEQLTASGVERSEAELVEEDQIGAKDGVDDPTDGVVSEAAVEVCR